MIVIQMMIVIVEEAAETEEMEEMEGTEETVVKVIVLLKKFVFVMTKLYFLIYLKIMLVLVMNTHLIR